MSIFKDIQEFQEGATYKFKDLIYIGIIILTYQVFVSWLQPNVIFQILNSDSIDRNIKFYLSDMEIDLNWDNARAIHSIKILAISSNLDLEMCDDVKLLSFQSYNLNFDSVLHSVNNAEILSATIEDIIINGHNKKYTLKLEIQSNGLSKVQYSDIVGKNKMTKIGDFKICIPYLNGSTRDSSILNVPIIIGDD